MDHDEGARRGRGGLSVLRRGDAAEEHRGEAGAAELLSLMRGGLERLPEENRYVLICTKHQAITDGRHERGTWWIAWDDRCYADEENLILAWMPQPAPYKEEGKDATD